MGEGGKLYAYDGLIYLKHLEWLKGSSESLTWMFDWLGIRKNLRKTARMIFQT